jgi:hypothetical protein
MNEIIKHSTDLFHEIDDCITNLIKARLDKNADKENEAIWNMERLMTTTMQHISWLVGELKGNSRIKWQTGEPKKSGTYLVAIRGKYSIFVQSAQFGVLTGWGYFKPEEILAWCRLSDIEPYKEE